MVCSTVENKPSEQISEFVRVKKKWNSYIEDEGARAAAWNQPDPIQKIHVEHWALQLDDRVRDAREKGIPVPSRELGKRFVKGQYIIC